MPKTFKQFWRDFNAIPEEEFVDKAALTQAEIVRARSMIRTLAQHGLNKDEIIAQLQKGFGKLRQTWKAERVYSTEWKNLERMEIQGNAEYLGLNKFSIMPNPYACKLCLQITDNGHKVFKKGDLTFKGQAIPPIHPNCYCILVPLE